MLKTTFALLFFLCSIAFAQAQSCLPQGISLYYQQNVDNFSAAYPGCTTIQGDVEITGDFITNLNGLSNIVSIGGDLKISTVTNLANLDGLNNLTHIGGNLIIQYNTNLSSLSALSKLNSIGGDLFFYANKLTSLSGLDNLVSVGGKVELQSTSVTNLSGLQNLTSIGTDLILWYNLAMTSISGLNKLSTVGGGIRIETNTKLASVSGLKALKTVGGNLIVQQSPLSSFTGLTGLTKVGGVFGIRGAPADLFLGNLDSVLTRLEIGTQAKNLAGYPKLRYTGSSLVISGNNLKSLAGMPLLRKITGLVLQNNASLSSLAGLENVDTLAGVITISDNDSLTSLQGLHNARVYLSDINVFTSFFIENNPVLSDCAIDLLCRNLVLTNHLQVWNNAPGCFDLNDVYNNCAYPVEAKVLIDKNNNCLSDAPDVPAAGVQVRLASAPRISLRETDANGIAALSRRGIFNFPIDLPHFPNKNWAVCQDSVVINAPDFADTARQTFLLKALTQCPDLDIRLGLPSTYPDCSKTSAVTVAVTNRGTIAAQATRAAVVMPPGLQLVSAVPAVSTQQGDTLFFNLGDMAPFAASTVRLTVKTACSGLKAGQALCVEAFGLLANACSPAQSNFSEIRISSECVGNSTVRFTLKNTGNTPTQGPHQYVVLRNKLRQKPVSFSLAPQETLTVDVPASGGATFRMEATKWDDGTLTARSHENCGGFTAGWVTAIWQDEGPSGRDFGCRQFTATPAGVVKSAIPSGAGVEKKVSPGHPIEYTIDFQNPRADTANRVLLRDYLSPQLDITGFLPVAASHPYTWEIRGDNTLEVVFNGAKLPPGGKGFFSFSLPQQPNLPDGTFVYNKAFVSFEYGAPLTTNTVEQTISELPGVGHACLPQGIQFYTQAEINNFPKDYEGCATILGNVDITGPNLSNLYGLIQLQHIEGNVVLYNLNQVNLVGLDSLRSVGGSVRVYNSSINSLTGLNRLDTIRGDLSIWYNVKIKNMSGLNRLRHVGNYISLRQNEDLVDLNLLQNLQTTGAGLEIAGNPALISLNGLNNLHSTGAGALGITGNNLLNNLTGLENLTQTGGLGLYYNQNLTDLSALANLDVVDGGITVEGNALLEDLSGLGKFDTIAGDMTIRANPALADVAGLEHLNAIGGNVVIEENPVLSSLNGLQNLSSVGGVLNINKQQLLENLSPLQNLHHLGGLHLDENGAMTDLSPLNNLPDELSTLLLRNLKVTSLSPFDKVKTVTGALVLAGLHTLPDLNGLGNLTKVGGHFILENLLGLSSLAGLGPVNQIGGDFSLFSNISLTGLSELGELKSVGGNLYLLGQPALPHLGGLGKLKSIGGALTIDTNEGLSSLDSLASLESISGDLTITNNAALSDCSIFAVCGHLLFSPKMAYIAGNAPGCNDEAEIEMNCHVLPVQARVLLDNNGDCLPDAGDLPVGDIQVKLNGAVRRATRPSDGTGIARFEYLRDGSFSLELPEFPSKNWDVCLEPVDVSTAGASDTVRAVMVLSPVYQCPDLAVQLHLPSQFRGCFAESEIQVTTQNTGAVAAESVRLAVVMPAAFELLTAVPASGTQSGDTLYFDLGNLTALEKKTVKLTVRTRCDFFVFGHTLCWESFATAQNLCPVTVPAFSEIKLSADCIADTLVRFKIKNIGDAPTQTPHEYQILRNAEPFDADIFSLKNQDSLTVDVPADGSTWRMEATKYDNGTRTAVALENCGGLTPGQINAFWLDRGAPNRDFGCREVIGAYDPNQKTAAPTGAGPERLLEANIPLRYTIDFQNTGTDTAFRVLLLDVLPAGLDAATFRPAASSHPCVWEIRGADSLEVLFFPIALPDSNVNEPASRGFFSFEIHQMPDLPAGTVLENTASIIFDFNPPIVTNTVQHRIGRLIVRVDEPQPHRMLWRVLGNPTRDAAVFEANEPVDGDIQFGLYDAAGRPVRMQRFAGQSFEFRREGLPAGLYIFRISDARGRIFAGSIVVTE